MCNCTSWFGPLLPTFIEIQKCAQFDALLGALFKFRIQVYCVYGCS